MQFNIRAAYVTSAAITASLLAALSSAADSRVVISPSGSVVVPVGTTVKFRANVPVKWSLAPGSAGSIDPDGTYHAPATIAVNNRMAGCQILPNDHVLNTRVDSLPLDGQSAHWIALIPPSGVNYLPSWGLNISDRDTPTHALHFAYTPQYDGRFEVVPWPRMKRENGVFSDPLSDVDRHMLTVDRDTCNVFEIYNEYSAGTNTSCPTCTAQSGIRYAALNSDLPHGSTDAAGLYLAPLTLRLEEIHSGEIRHALRVTLNNSLIAPTAVWPASSHAGAWGKIPYGTRFRLRANFDDSHLSPIAKVLVTQLKRYGLILADGGANWEVDVSTDVTEDNAAMSAFAEVGRTGLNSRDFEVVDEHSLALSPESGRVKPENEFLKPDSFVRVIATEVDRPAAVSEVSVTLQGITVGVPDPAIWIQSGAIKKLNSWVNGAADKSVTWSMSPNLGKLTFRGEYTPPTVTKPTAVTLLATSNADKNAIAVLQATIMPPGPIRIDVGNATGAPGAPNHSAPDYGPDSQGHMWWREQAGEIGWGVAFDDWYGYIWPKSPDIGLYYTRRYSINDMVYRFAVPNGNYKITLKFAQTGCKGKFPKIWSVPMHLETQGQLLVPSFDMGLPIDYACNTPVDQIIPATVTDNELYFALRRVTHGKYAPSPMFNAFSIEPDSATPYLTLYPSPAPPVETGQQIDFHAIGWYMSNAVEWTVAGPGSISQKGAYTAPSLPAASDEKVTVRARSLGKPNIVAAATFTLKSGAFMLSPEQATVPIGLSQQFKAVMGSAPYSRINWSISPELGTISADGSYTAPDALGQDTKVTIKAASKDDPKKVSEAVVTVKSKPDPIRVNCGDQGGFKDAQGNVWAADYGFSTGTMAYHDNRVQIANASKDMQALYQSSRYKYDNDSFAYDFRVPNGRYSVTLSFADYSYDNAGHYRFDVKLNGAKVLAKFDPDQAHGGKTAVDKIFETTVHNKQVHIEFIGNGASPEVNGIEIIYLGPA